MSYHVHKWKLIGNYSEISSNPFKNSLISKGGYVVMYYGLRPLELSSPLIPYILSQIAITWEGKEGASRVLVFILSLGLFGLVKYNQKLLHKSD